MMKVQVCDVSGQLTIQVCGRLADAWVPELERSWLAAHSSHADAAISVDLRGVTFVDALGRSLLERMHKAGATFIASGLMIREIVEQITRNEA